MNTKTVADALTDENVQDIVDTAACGGITYWATEPTGEERAAMPAGKDYVVVEGDGPCPFFGGEREIEAVHYLDKGQIRSAYAKLLDLDQQYVNREYHGYVLQSWIERTDKDGIDAGYIDAGTADVIIQVAIFDKVVYG